MSVKENSDSESTFVRLFDEEWKPAVDELPTAITTAGFLLLGSCIFMSISESAVEMVQNILYTQIHIWQIMSTQLICHWPKISMGELLHHTLNEYACGDEGSGIFRGIQREHVRNSRTQLNILSTVYVTQTKIHQSNNAFQHTHNPVDEEGTLSIVSPEALRLDVETSTFFDICCSVTHGFTRDML